MAVGARLRGWYQGAPYTGALLNMNNCGLEKENGDFKGTVEKNSPMNRFLLRSALWLRQKSLQKIPTNPNYVGFQTTPTVTESMWVAANYIFNESTRTEADRFSHIIPAFLDGTPPVRVTRCIVYMCNVCMYVCTIYTTVRQ